MRRAPSPLDHGWWLASRASGIVAFGLIAGAVLLGLTMAGRVSRRPGLARVLMRAHEQLALAGLVAICLHGVTLLGDAWLRPGIEGIAVPFTMAYRPLYTGLGVLAAYLAALLGLSFYLRRRIGARVWRRLHRLTIVVYGLSVVHVLGAGTDAAAFWLRAVLVATGVPIVGLLAYRLAPRRRVAADPIRSPPPVQAEA